MSVPVASRVPRQSLVLVGILGLHVGAFLLLTMSMKAPPFIEWIPKTIRVVKVPLPPEPVARPEIPEPTELQPALQPFPSPPIPTFPDVPIAPATHAPGAAPVGHTPNVPATEVQPPGLRTRDVRLAALVDACYPAASRRLGEEGRAVARVAIGVRGNVAAWSVSQSSGFPRLDYAVGCVLRRLEFVPGRHDGRAVDAEALLPIVFQLN